MEERKILILITKKDDRRTSKFCTCVRFMNENEYECYLSITWHDKKECYHIKCDEGPYLMDVYLPIDEYIIEEMDIIKENGKQN